jgi:hypothetical protein
LSQDGLRTCLSPKTLSRIRPQDITSTYILISNFMKINKDIIMSTHILISNLMKTRKNCFRYLKLMSPLNVAICTTSYTLWVEWYYLKNNYLTLRSKVKVPRRSLRYATHRLMVMHPHTKYHWPMSKDKNVMAWITGARSYIFTSPGMY